MDTFDTFKKNLKKTQISKPKAVNRKQKKILLSSFLHSVIFVAPAFLLSAFLISCSQPTDNNKITYSGTVTLEDTTDFSGVTVSLYVPVELDPSG